MNSSLDSGIAFLVYGKLSFGTAQINMYQLKTQGVTILGPGGSCSLGGAVVGADLNNDGLNDMVLGKKNLSSVIDTAALSPSIGIRIYHPNYIQFGSSLAKGDANGDGIDDIIVGAWLDGFRAGYLIPSKMQPL